MDIPSAEMTKYAANAMLATRISFMNDIANLCELVGANVDSVRKGIDSDTRIGNKFLYAGCGYGGSCFPKDVKALVHTGLENDYHMEVIEAVERVNEKQKSIVYEKILKVIGSVMGKTIAVIGLALKPETDDMREAPALVVIDKPLKDGASVRVLTRLLWKSVNVALAILSHIVRICMMPQTEQMFCINDRMASVPYAQLECNTKSDEWSSCC